MGHKSFRNGRSLVSYGPALFAQGLMFNVSRLFVRSTSRIGCTDFDLMVECFVSMFRINPHSTDLMRVCLSPQSPIKFRQVLTCALHRLITQVRTVSILRYRLHARFVFNRILKRHRSFLFHSERRHDAWANASGSVFAQFRTA